MTTATTERIKKVLNFGKVDYTRSGWKNCLVTIEVNLSDGRLSICGNIWNPLGTDIYSGGQNLDQIAELLPLNAKVKRIVAIWERWHLNDMKAGSPAQEAWLREHPVTAVYPESHYTKASAALAEAGLNPDNGYSYGSKWLMEELPAEVIAEVESW